MARTLYDKNNLKKVVLGGLASVLILFVLLSTRCQTEEGRGNDSFVTLATTTSTYDSGLLDAFLPVFTEKHGIEVRVIARGTGQALELAKRGDVDLVLVHDRDIELKLVKEGYFTDRYDVMYNDFIIVGPTEDVAELRGLDDVIAVFTALEQESHDFISRGDDSGTNRKELFLWETAGIDPLENENYKSVGQGMGDTLRMANEIEAYTLSDRGSYLSLKDTLSLEIIFAWDPLLFNQYGIMAVNPEMHSHVKYDAAKKLIDFMVSEEGKAIIEGFTIGGEVLFFGGKGVGN